MSKRSSSVLGVALILSAVAVFSFVGETTFVSQTAFAAQAQDASKFTGTDAEVAEFGKKYVEKFRANPAKTYVDSFNFKKIDEALQKDKSGAVTDEMLKIIRKEVLNSSTFKRNMIQQVQPLFAGTDFFFIGVKRLSGKTYVVIRAENTTSGVNYFMLECARDADGEIVASDLFLPLQGFTLSESIAANMIDGFALMPRGISAFSPTKQKEFEKFASYQKAMSEAMLAQNYARMVELYETHNIAKREMTQQDVAYISALTSLYAQTTDEDEGDEIERKIKETTRRIESRSPGYIGGAVALIDVYSTKGQKSEFEDAVETVVSLVGPDPYWDFHRAIAFDADAPEKQLKAFRKAREDGLVSRTFYIIYLSVLAENFPENTDEIEEIAELYQENFGEALPF